MEDDTLGNYSNLEPPKLKAADTLKDKLSLLRALRPLIRQVESQAFLLDEEATVQNIIDSEVWLPTLSPSLEHWLDVMIVVDTFHLATDEQQKVLEFARLLSQFGIFRDVTKWSLDIDNEGDFYLTSGLFQNSSHKISRHPSNFLDPSGRRLILLLSKCTASFWTDGSVIELLEIWSHSSLTIIQLLPELLWGQTTLGLKIPEEVMSAGPMQSNRQLITRFSKQDVSQSEHDLLIPVITLEPKILDNWSKVVAGFSSAKTSAFNIRKTLDERKKNLIRRGKHILSEEERINWFKIIATPMEREKAGL